MINTDSILKFDAYPKQDPNDNGLGNAAILNFSKDTIDSVVKELTQNSIDALKVRRAKLKVRINRFDIQKSEIPDMENFAEIIGNLKDYWKKNDNDVRTFQQIEDILRNDKISVFSFEDYNTNGLDGNVSEGTFKSLVIDEGVTNHDHKGALGGYGIGKNALFAFSTLKTVFYSSVNANKETKFMGVTKLADYRDKNQTKKAGRIYYGKWTDKDGFFNVGHLSDPHVIPTLFKRSEPGLSSFALGLNTEKDWLLHVEQAFIRNYWFLFEQDLLEAEICEGGEVKIVLDHENYYERAKAVFTEDNSVMAYIETYRNPDKKHDSISIYLIGKTVFMLKEQPDGDTEYPNKFVYIRDGMMIMEKQSYQKGLPNKFAGIIYCDDENGNDILGRMEPPTHNDFQPTLLPKGTIHTEEDGKKILNEIENQRSSLIKELRAQYTKATKNVALIDDLIFGNKGMSAGKGRGNVTVSDEEKFNKIIESITVKKPSQNANRKVQIKSNESEEEIEAKDDAGKEGGRLPTGDGPREGEQPGAGDGTGGTGSKGEIKSPIKTKRISAVKANAKFFISSSSGKQNDYQMIVRTNRDVEAANMQFTQFGDSGSGPMGSVLKAVYTINGTKCLFSPVKSSSISEANKGYIIENVKLAAGKPNIFKLKIEEKEVSAFKLVKIS